MILETLFTVTPVPDPSIQDPAIFRSRNSYRDRFERQLGHIIDLDDTTGRVIITCLGTPHKVIVGPTRVDFGLPFVEPKKAKSR